MATTPARGPLVPPVYALGTLLLMIALHYVFPVARIVPEPLHVAGLALIAIAFALDLWSAFLFLRARTAMIPFKPSSALVATGPYRFTRNPMYLGMAGALFGAAVYLGTLMPFFALPLFIMAINTRFIAAEEALLEETFGEAYTRYKEKVRRWI